MQSLILFRDTSTLLCMPPKVSLDSENTLLRFYFLLLIQIPDFLQNKRRRLDIEAPRTPTRGQGERIQSERKWYAFKCGWFCKQSLAESLPRIDTMEKMESKMAVAFKPFEEYIKCLASGKLDGYLDSTRREDKVTVPGVSLLKEPFLLLHDLGMNVDMKRIENLFIRDTVCVASAQL